MAAMLFLRHDGVERLQETVVDARDIKRQCATIAWWPMNKDEGPPNEFARHLVDRNLRLDVLAV